MLMRTRCGVCGFLLGDLNRVWILNERKSNEWKCITDSSDACGCSSTGRSLLQQAASAETILIIETNWSPRWRLQLIAFHWSLPCTLKNFHRMDRLPALWSKISKIQAMWAIPLPGTSSDYLPASFVPAFLPLDYFGNVLHSSVFRIRQISFFLISLDLWSRQSLILEFH